MNDEKQDVNSIQQIIAKEFGFETLEDEKQQALVERMSESVIKRVLVEAYARLSESDREVFEEMMENIENIDPNDIDKFLQEKLTDYDAVIVAAVEDLKKHLAQAN